MDLDFVSILTGFCLRLQPTSTGITGTKWFPWNLLLLFLLWSLVIPNLQNNILMFGWPVVEFPLGWMAWLNKSLNSFSSESRTTSKLTYYTLKIELECTKRMSKIYLHSFNGLLAHSFTQSRSKFSVLNETKNLKGWLYGMLYFSTKFMKTGCSQ